MSYQNHMFYSLHHDILGITTIRLALVWDHSFPGMDVCVFRAAVEQW